jgi:hypothetical protein
MPGIAQLCVGGIPADHPPQRLSSSIMLLAQSEKPPEHARPGRARIFLPRDAVKLIRYGRISPEQVRTRRMSRILSR